MRHSALHVQRPVPATSAEMVEEVGAELRRLRKARGMTLSELARLSGLSTGFISQAERGISPLSIKALQDLSRALGVHINWFFQEHAPPPEEEKGIVVRAGARRRINYGALGIVDQLLSPNLAGQIEFLLCHLGPGASSGDEPYSHEGEEAGLIVAGALELWVGQRHFHLDEGDSFSFKSTEPHRYRNPGPVPTVVAWVITPPSF